MAQVGSMVAVPGSTLAFEPSRSVRPGLLLPALSLCRRELVRFLRQRHRIIGSLATPIVFWLLLGAGMGRSFHFQGLPPGATFLQYFFPGTVLMILLFTSIFSTISIIEDRREGFLQSVLVAPVPRMSIVLGKILGATALACGEGFVFLLIAPFAGVPLTFGGFLAACGMMFIISFALSGLGFCIAWRMTSTQGFHAIMNLLVLPLWMVSGALFPQENAWPMFRWVMRINPLSYGMDGLWRSLFSGDPAALSVVPGWGLILAVSFAFAAAMLLLASGMARVRTGADLQ